MGKNQKKPTTATEMPTVAELFGQGVSPTEIGGRGYGWIVPPTFVTACDEALAPGEATVWPLKTFAKIVGKEPNWATSGPMSSKISHLRREVMAQTDGRYKVVTRQNATFVGVKRIS